MGKKTPTQNFYMPELLPEDRFRQLEADAMKQETRSYYKPLSPGEVNQKRTEFVDNAGEIALLEQDLKAIKNEFKGKIDPIKAINGTLMHEINTKQKQVTGKMFYIQDWDTFEIVTYDEQCVEIGRRKMYPDERQKRASFPLLKVSNGDGITDINVVGEDDDNDDE